MQEFSLHKMKNASISQCEWHWMNDFEENSVVAKGRLEFNGGTKLVVWIVGGQSTVSLLCSSLLWQQRVPAIRLKIVAHGTEKM